LLALCFGALHALFNFPAQAPAARGAEDVYFVIILYLCMLLGMAAQPSILTTKLPGGVERWHRLKTAGEKPWFFQQVENLYSVILPAKDKLSFNVSVAFLVGVSQYDHLSPGLPFVENDLTDMRKFLLNQGGFDTVYVVAKQAASPSLVQNYMMNRFRRATDCCFITPAMALILVAARAIFNFPKPSQMTLPATCCPSIAVWK
jgi:hypothetical protein